MNKDMTINQEDKFREYQYNTELQKTYNRGEVYISSLLRDLDDYNDDFPETYAKVGLYSQLKNSSRIQYNVFAVGHFMANKVLLENGIDVPFDYQYETERYINILRIQNLAKGGE